MKTTTKATLVAVCSLRSLLPLLAAPRWLAFTAGRAAISYRRTGPLRGQ